MTDVPHDSTAKPSLDAAPAIPGSWSTGARLSILAGLTLEVAQFVASPADPLSLDGWVRIAGIGLIGVGLAIQFVRVRPAAVEPEREPARETATPEAAAPAPSLLEAPAPETVMPDAPETTPAPEPQTLPQQQAVTAAIAAPEPVQPRVARDDVIREQSAAIADRLKPFAGTCFDGALTTISGEPADFWWGVKAALVAAEWRQVSWTASPGSRGGAGVKNVEIHLHPDSRDRLMPAATALMSALAEAGIATKDIGFDCASANADAVHILIGRQR